MGIPVLNLCLMGTVMGFWCGPVSSWSLEVFAGGSWRGSVSGTCLGWPRGTAGLVLMGQEVHGRVLC